MTTRFSTSDAPATRAASVTTASIRKAALRLTDDFLLGELAGVAPAGQINNGIDDGPTVLSPSMSIFHSFSTGTAIQGYVGKNATLNAPTTYTLPRSAHYGLALQQPVGDEFSGLNNLYFFLGALGRYRYVNPTPAMPDRACRSCRACTGSSATPGGYPAAWRCP